MEVYKVKLSGPLGHTTIRVEADNETEALEMGDKYLSRNGPTVCRATEATKETKQSDG